MRAAILQDRTGLLGFRPYQHGDAAKIEPRADFDLEHRSMGSPLHHGVPEGMAYTVFRRTGGDDVPIACGGAFQAGHHYTLWGYAGELSGREWSFVCRWIAWVLEAGATWRGINGASALVREDFPQAERFLRRLGFRRAGMERAVDGACAWVMTCNLTKGD